jgi:hypothetical protein
VIVTRGQREALARSLEALSGAESVIVVDDAASDSAGLDEKYPQVHFIRIPRSFGLTRAWNIGIRAATGEYVLLLSPEVEITPGAVNEMAASLDAEPQTGAVCPLLVSHDGRAQPQVSELPTPSAPHPPLRAAAAGERVPCANGKALMLRSFFLGALRNIDERYTDYGAFIELAQQVKRAGKTILVHPAVMAEIKPDEIPISDADRERGTSRFLSKHYGFLPGTLYLTGRVLSAVATFRFGKLGRLFS